MRFRTMHRGSGAQRYKNLLLSRSASAIQRCKAPTEGQTNKLAKFPPRDTVSDYNYAREEMSHAGLLDPGL